jgi:hypothetical protein
MKARNHLLEDLLYRSVRYTPWFTKVCKLVTLSAREAFLNNVMELVARSRIEGDYLEFGVYAGRTFVAAYHFAQMMNLGRMRFYGFDSFQGLPQITGEDLGGEFSEGEYAYTLDDFGRLISRRGVRMDKVQLVSGWYDRVLNAETKRSLPIRAAAVIFIDCDLYESTVPVLGFVADYVQSGTIVAFDDWYCFRGDPEKGEQKAFREWLANNPSFEALEYRRFAAHGNSFIMRKHER